ncbi:MAG: hypothetical protein ACLR0U_11380 [Enterocloster clostridioformis]
MKGLPILFSVHGRGEPVWLFAEKNGWDVLADETQAFVLVCPDSPGNIWQLERDGQVFGAMIDRLCADYGLDRTRVYLTGFSERWCHHKGGGDRFSRTVCSHCPSNAPVDAPGLVADSPVSPGLLRSGYELPYWVCVGDNDPQRARMWTNSWRSCWRSMAARRGPAPVLPPALRPMKSAPVRTITPPPADMPRGAVQNSGLLWTGRAAAGGIHRDEEYAPRGDL